MYKRIIKIIIFCLIYNILLGTVFLAAQEEELSEPVGSSEKTEEKIIKDEKKIIPEKKTEAKDEAGANTNDNLVEKNESSREEKFNLDSDKEKSFKNKGSFILKDLILLDSDLSKVKISRIPNIEKFQNFSKQNDDNKDSGINQNNEKSNLSEVVKSDQSSKNDQGFVKVNKEKGKWQAIIIVFSLIFILIFYKVKTKNRRKRIFRRMPKR